MHGLREGSSQRIAAAGAAYRPGQVMRQIDPALVQEMARRLRCLKAQHIMDELGINLNTWKKLLDGEPIRASVAQRLLDRFHTQSLVDEKGELEWQ